MANKSYKSNTPRIVAGNDFTLSIMVYVPNYEDVETNGKFKPLDLSTCTDISVSLVCGKHTTIIPLEFTLAEEEGLILAQVQEYQVHEGSKYGIEVKGKTADGQDWRWYLAQSEGIYITNNTSQSNMVAGVANRKLDIYARVGFNVPVPEIDPETNHWLVGDIDTGVVARGEDGDTPYIGDNGNWWLGDSDTGVLAYREDFVTSNVADCVIKFVENLPPDAAFHPNTIYITPERVDYLKYPEMVRYVATALADYRTDTQNDEKFLQISDAQETYLTLADATATYLSKQEAHDDYLKKTTAANTYLTPTAGDERYVKITDAVHTYLTQTEAANTYLSQNAALDQYWTKAAANTVFLKKYEAAATYATIDDLAEVASHIVDLSNYATMSWVNNNYMPSSVVDAFYVKKSELRTNYYTKEQTIELIENYMHDWNPTGPVTPTGTTPTGTTPTGTTPTGTTPTGSSPTGNQLVAPVQITIPDNVTDLRNINFTDYTANWTSTTNYPHLCSVRGQFGMEANPGSVIFDAHPEIYEIPNYERYVKSGSQTGSLIIALPYCSDIFIPQTVETMYDGTFVELGSSTNTNIIFTSINPPTLDSTYVYSNGTIVGGDGFLNYLNDSHIRIYVPDNSVEAYKAAFRHTNAVIHPLSEYDGLYQPDGWSLPTQSVAE